MAGEIQDLTSVAASHARYPEGQAPSTLNDSARVVEGIISRWFFDTNYSVVATVSGTVIQMTANRVSLTLTATTSNYMADLLMAFTVGSSALVGPNVSINLNGIGPIPLRDNGGASLSATFAVAGTRCMVIKDDANNYFRLLLPTTTFAAKGTFTPTIAGSSSNPTPTYTAQSGSYTKIGDRVYFNIFISTSGIAGGAGDLRISGLPFTAGETIPCSIQTENVGWGASKTSAIGVVITGTAYIVINGEQTSSTVYTVQISDWAGSGSTIRLAGQYAA